MIREEAYKIIEDVRNQLQDEYYTSHPDEKELPSYIWKLYWVAEYLYRRKKKEAV